MVSRDIIDHTSLYHYSADTRLLLATLAELCGIQPRSRGPSSTFESNDSEVRDLTSVESFRCNRFIGRYLRQITLSKGARVKRTKFDEWKTQRVKLEGIEASKHISCILLCLLPPINYDTLLCTINNIYYGETMLSVVYMSNTSITVPVIGNYVLRIFYACY